MPVAPRLAAVALTLLCLSCRTRPDGAGPTPATFDEAARRLISRLPRADFGPDASTRPSLVGEVLFDREAAGVADFFTYTAVRDEQGRTFLLQRGGLAYVSRWYGPVDPADAASARLLADVRRLPWRRAAGQ